MEELIRLRCGGLNATIAPAAGGSVASFSEERDGRAVDWLRPASPGAIAAGDALGMASFPLVPFCNRIRDGRFTFDGEQIVLAPNFGDSPHTLHGIGWQRRWEAVADRQSARLRYVHRPDAWPFAFEAEQLFTLDEQGLRVEMSVTNTGTRPMPVGLGHHPYYRHQPGTTISAHTDAIWLGDAEVMPVSLAPGHLVVRELERGMAVRAHDLDNHFTGWNRRATIDWPGGRRLTIWAEAPLDYLVLYTPARADFFCLEPVSNCTDWLNLRATHAPQQVGGAILAPGQTIATRCGWSPSWQA
jgi:aldose 1-epimerase